MDNHSAKICILSFLRFPWCKMQRFAPIYIKSAPISLIQAILSQTGLLIFRKLLKPQLKYRAPWQTLISPITSVATFDCNQLKNIPRKAGPDKNEKQVYLLTRRRENILIYMLPSQQNLDKAKLIFKTIPKLVSGKQFSRIEVNSCYDHPATSWSSGSKMHFKTHSFDLRYQMF